MKKFTIKIEDTDSNENIYSSYTIPDEDANSWYKYFSKMADKFYDKLHEHDGL